MDLNEYTEMLRRELGSVTRFGGEEFTRTAEMLADALESSVRLTLLEALSAAEPGDRAQFPPQHLGVFSEVHDVIMTP